MFFTQADEIVRAVEALEASEQADALVNQEIKTPDEESFVEKSDSNHDSMSNEELRPISANDCIFALPQDKVLDLVEVIEKRNYEEIQVFEVVPNYVGGPSSISKSPDYETKFYINNLPVYILSANIRDLSSLNGNEWIAETVINDWAHYIIRANGRCNSILYMPPNLYRCFMGEKLDDEKSENIIKFLVNNRTMEKDIILICIPAEGDDKHVMLGIIYLNTKRITILDPKQVDDYTSRQHFDYLHRIVSVAYKAYGLNFQEQQWQSYFPKRIARQSNEFDCGVFVCSYIHRVVANMKIQDIDTVEGRRRIKYILSNCITIDPPEHEDICTPFMINSLAASLSESFDIQKFIVEDFEIHRRNRSKPPRAVSVCYDRFCFRLLSSQSDSEQFFCLGCRGWYHKDCVYYDEPSRDYSACPSCQK